MIAVLQRVSGASVCVDGLTVGACEAGLCVLLGVAKGDTEADADALAAKTVGLRIFCDEDGKMNRSVTDVQGGALVVSNFTLLADYSHGNRPSYFEAAAPAEAEALYTFFADELKALVPLVEHGVFGADMQITMTADGPVTIVMDSDKLKKTGKGGSLA